MERDCTNHAPSANEMPDPLAARGPVVTPSVGEPARDPSDRPKRRTDLTFNRGSRLISGDAASDFNFNREIARGTAAPLDR